MHEYRGVKFSTVHEDFVTKLINSALKNNVKRIIHLSALGTSKKSLSKYLNSKYKGELIIRDKFKKYDWTN